MRIESSAGKSSGRRLAICSGLHTIAHRRLYRVNYFCRRIDSRFLLPERCRLPQINCYRSSAPVRGGGGDGEATEYGDTAGIETGSWGTLPRSRQLGAPADPGRGPPGDRLSPQTRAAGAASDVRGPATTAAAANL